METQVGKKEADHEADKEPAAEVVAGNEDDVQRWV
jgi:hypothetical protein